MDTVKQIAALNSLVTYAAERLQYRMTPEEAEVVQIVGRMAAGEHKAIRTHVYKVANATGYGAGMGDMGAAIHHWAGMGWRVVGIVSDTRSGYAHSLVLERPVGITHPDD